MCECFHRTRARKISLKSGASTPTFSLAIGDVCWQTTALDLSPSISLAAYARISSFCARGSEALTAVMGRIASSNWGRCHRPFSLISSLITSSDRM